MWRSAFAGAMILAIFSASSLAQTSQDLKADAGTTGDVLVYGMGYSGQRFSPLTQITKENVGRLVPVWAYSLADLQGGEGFPLVNQVRRLHLSPVLCFRMDPEVQ
jgi:alcohol dehydrogenase (cytochrome c)